MALADKFTDGGVDGVADARAPSAGAAGLGGSDLVNSGLVNSGLVNGGLVNGSLFGGHGHDLSIAKAKSFAFGWPSGYCRKSQ
jgi:hypothetical protein